MILRELQIAIIAAGGIAALTGTASAGGCGGCGGYEIEPYAQEYVVPAPVYVEPAPQAVYVVPAPQPVYVETAPCHCGHHGHAPVNYPWFGGAHGYDTYAVSGHPGYARGAYGYRGARVAYGHRYRARGHVGYRGHAGYRHHPRAVAHPGHHGLAPHRHR